MEMTVSKEFFLKFSKKIEKANITKLSFSLIIGSLFPEAWRNIQQALKDEHMKGYLEAKEEEN